eukprot:720144-Amphidinium_carterae.1
MALGQEVSSSDLLLELIRKAILRVHPFSHDVNDGLQLQLNARAVATKVGESPNRIQHCKNEC